MTYKAHALDAGTGKQTPEEAIEPCKEAGFYADNFRSKHLLDQVGVTVAGDRPCQLVASPPRAHKHPSFIPSQIPQIGPIHCSAVLFNCQ